MNGWAAMFEKNGSKMEVEIFSDKPMDRVNEAKTREEANGWKYLGVRPITGPSVADVTMGGRFGCE